MRVRLSQEKLLGTGCLLVEPERERSHKLINDWKQDVSSNIDSPVPRPSKNFNKPRKAPVIPGTRFRHGLAYKR